MALIKKIKIDYKTYAYYLGYYFLKSMPISLVAMIGKKIGQTQLVKNKAENIKLLNNIKEIFPDIENTAQHNEMVGSTWKNIGINYVDYSVLPRILNSKRIIFEDEIGLAELLKTNRPIIFLTVHLSNTEIVIPALLNRIKKYSTKHFYHVYKNLKNKKLLKLLKKTRTHIEDHLIGDGPNVGRKIYNHLLTNNFLSLNVDEVKNKNVLFPCFGRDFPLKGNINFAIRLAKLTNAMIVPYYGVRTKKGGFIMKIGAPYKKSFASLNDKEIDEVKKSLDETFTSIITDNFDQWAHAVKLKLV